MEERQGGGRKEGSPAGQQLNSPMATPRVLLGYCIHLDNGHGQHTSQGGCIARWVYTYGQFCARHA